MELTIKEIDISNIGIQIGIESIMYEHFNEVSPNGDESKIAVDWETMSLLQKGSILISFGCFSEDILVGYLLLMVHKQLHYKNTTVATIDTVFVLKDFRVGRIGLKMIKLAEDVARERGATEIMFNVKEGSPLERVLKIREYSIRDIVFKKEL